MSTKVKTPKIPKIKVRISKPINEYIEKLRRHRELSKDVNIGLY